MPEQNRPAGIRDQQPQGSKSKVEPKFLVNTITQAVASNLNISMGNKPHNTTNGLSGDTGKPYLGKTRPPQLALGIDGSLNPELTCWYCKHTSHLKENCVS